MSEKITLTLAGVGAPDMEHALVGKKEGGQTDRSNAGIAERLSGRLSDVTMTTHFHAQPGGFREIRRSLEEGSSALAGLAPDVVVLSISDDVVGLGSRADSPEAAVEAVRQDLLAIVAALKQLPAHVLVANVSTVDPAETSYTYHGLSEEPFSLRAHRLALMLVGVSQEQGISIIDVDRLIAEIGAEGNVAAALEYSDDAAAVISDEIARILEDYGFFDQRPLVAQTGSQGGKS